MTRANRDVHIVAHYSDDVADLQYCCKQQRLYAFHPDHGLLSSTGSCIQCWDAGTGQNTATMTEFLEHYQLACFCIPNQGNAVHQLVAGSVTDGEPCPSSSAMHGRHESLCNILVNHKPISEAALHVILPGA